MWRIFIALQDATVRYLGEMKHVTVEPGYNDIGLCDTSSITSDILVSIDSLLLTITLYCSVLTTLIYKGTKYSVPFIAL
jgi:hypothetical protein